MRWTDERPSKPGLWMFRKSWDSDITGGRVDWGDWKKAQNPEELYYRGSSEVKESWGLWLGPIQEGEDVKNEACDYKSKLDSIIKNIEHLARALEEKRSDISDLLYGMLDGSFEYPKSLEAIESRYVQGDIPLGREASIKVYYDTLATMLSYRVDCGGEKCVMFDCNNIEYSDD